jgi:hypothetical protein
VGADGEICAWNTGTGTFIPQGNPVFYGINTQANSAANSVTIGYNASTLTSPEGVAIGYLASITGSAGGIAIGQSAIINTGTSLTGLIAIGNTVFASHTGCVVIGAASQCQSLGGIAIGSNAHVTSSSNIGIAIGSSVTSNAEGAIVIGSVLTSLTVSTSVTLGYNTGPYDASHAFALGINTASVEPATLGVTLNGARRVIEAYGSFYASTTSGAGPFFITNTAAKTQLFTVSGTVQLPTVTGGFQLGFTYVILNRSAGNLIVQTATGNTIITLTGHTAANVMAVSLINDAATSWVATGPTTIT